MTTFQSELERRFKLQKEFLGDNKPVNQIQPLVSVSCATYQHSPYIRQCIEGFLMQKTTFPIEIIVGEDGSSDETAEICKEYAEKYPDLIRLFLRDRSLSQYYDDEGKFGGRFNGIWCRMSARGKYIALCEGDDYWIDPLKLQKQVDYMEKDNQCKLCYTRSYTINSLSTNFSNQILGKPVLSYVDLLLNNTIPTLTVMVKKDIYSEYARDGKFFPRNEWLMGDYPTWLYIANRTKVVMLPDICSVYRILPESLSHGGYNKIRLFVESAKKIALFFDHLYCKDKNQNLINEKYNRDLFVLSFTHKEYENALLYYHKYEKKHFRDRFMSFIIICVLFFNRLKH